MYVLALVRVLFLFSRNFFFFFGGGGIFHDLVLFLQISKLCLKIIDRGS